MWYNKYKLNKVNTKDQQISWPLIFLGDKDES
nr:MAG TPA: hypothetical protein [Caudoviricetes sp.]